MTKIIHLLPAHSDMSLAGHAEDLLKDGEEFYVSDQVLNKAIEIAYDKNLDVKFRRADGTELTPGQA